MTDQAQTQRDYQLVPISLIDSPALETRFRPDDGAITRLAQSINTVGLLQPVILSRQGDRYRLIAGQRRLRAFLLLGRQEIPAHVVALPEPLGAIATVTENLRRRQLTPLEEAVSLSSLLEAYDMTQEQLAKQLGVDRTWVTHRLQLLRLPDDLMDALVYQDLAPSAALELVRIKDDTDRKYYLSLVLRDGATLMVVRDWVRTYLDFNSPAKQLEQESRSDVDLPPAPRPYVPSCLVCGKSPPQTPLKMVYLCWTCARALEDAAKGEEK